MRHNKFGVLAVGGERKVVQFVSQKMLLLGQDRTDKNLVQKVQKPISMISFVYKLKNTNKAKRPTIKFHDS